MIYFWQGRDSTTDEKGASALLATQLDDSGAPGTGALLDEKGRLFIDRPKDGFRLLLKALQDPTLPLQLRHHLAPPVEH